jgi:hypothetical protein
MKKRTIALLAGALMLLLAVPAGASSHTHVGSATGFGLNLQLADEALTIGRSEAAVQSAPSAEACGEDRGQACALGASLYLAGEGVVARAHAPGNEGPEDTTGIPIPEDFSPLITGEIGPARAVAGLEPTGTSARGDGGVLTLNLTATQTLAENIPVQEVVEQISDGLLGPIADGDPSGLGERLKGTVDQLNENLSQTPLVSLSAGATISEASDIDGVTTVSALARGAVLVIGPTLENDLINAPEGLIILEVGAASASASTNQQTATATFDPALVRLRVFDPTTNDYDVVEIAPGDPATCGGEDTPLETCVTVGGGETVVQGAGAAATAAGVSIRTLADPLPTLRLDLAAVEAAVNAAPPAPPEPEPAPVLPRTGVDLALPALGLLSVGAAGAFGLRRRTRR